MRTNMHSPVSVSQRIPEVNTQVLCRLEIPHTDFRIIISLSCGINYLKIRRLRYELMLSEKACFFSSVSDFCETDSHPTVTPFGNLHPQGFYMPGSRTRNIRFFSDVFVFAAFGNSDKSWLKKCQFIPHLCFEGGVLTGKLKTKSCSCNNHNNQKQPNSDNKIAIIHDSIFRS